MITKEKKVVRVGKYVNTEYVNTVLREYKKERWVHNSERIGKEDSLSIWFSVEDVADFLATSKLNGADGIKFYFSAYPKDFAEKPEYAGRQSIVMVATKSKETEHGNNCQQRYLHYKEWRLHYSGRKHGKSMSSNVWIFLVPVI